MLAKNNPKLAVLLRILIVIVGSFIVSFGSIVFLEPNSINSGGCHGIGLIFELLTSDENAKLLIYNIVTSSLTIVFWLVGLFVLGKHFALTTLVATISLPLANWTYSYLPGVSDFVQRISAECAGSDIGNLLLCGVFGGVCVGAGVAITFVGGGSTGGVDVIVVILDKFARIKSSLASFMVDATIILLGMIFMGFDFIPELLCGILSAFISALLIETIYVGFRNCYQVDVISDKWEEISRFTQDVLGRGATIIPVKGGYKGEDRIILRLVIDKTQLNDLKDNVAKVDPKAFVTYTVTSAVYGEGFNNHKNKKTKGK